MTSPPARGVPTSCDDRSVTDAMLALITGLPERSLAAGEVVYRTRRSAPGRRAGGAFIEIDLDERRLLSELVSGVEQPRTPALLGPITVGRERRLVDVAAQHDIGRVGVEQAGELRVAVVARSGPREQTLRWTVERPRPVGRPIRRGLVEPLLERCERLGILPPRARRQPPAAEIERVAIDDDSVRRASVSRRVVFSPESVRLSRSWLPEHATVGTRAASRSR